MYIKSLVDFFPVFPTYHISKMTKILLLISPGGYYGMSEARGFSSFQHIFDPLFGGDLVSVLTIFTDT